MHIVVAPDKFAGTLSAIDVARSFERGWLRVRPGDSLDLVPLSDGGPGFVDCLEHALGGTIQTLTVYGPTRMPVPAQVLLVPSGEPGLGPSRERGGVAYVESAQANGLHLVPSALKDPEWTTTFGVGQLIAAAVEAGARTIVVGLGGSATNDGGAGLVAALGATARGPSGDDATQALAGGPGALRDVRTLDLGAAREAVSGCDLVIATDVDNPLLGPTGATYGFGRQKGADADDLPRLESALHQWRAMCEAAGCPRELAGRPGAGAAGGLGYGLMAAGARRVSGIDTVLAAIGLSGRLSGADLVITGEGRFDWQSLRGKVVSGVVQAAQPLHVPVVVVAGQNLVAGQEWRSLGIASVRSLVDQAGSVEAAMSAAAPTLEALAEDLAGSYR